MTNYVIINGVNSNTINGLGINELPPITKPLQRSLIEEIDGRDGDIITKLGYGAYDKTMTIGLFHTYDIDEVIAFFNGEGTITFSNEPDKVYYFTILDQIDYEKLINFKTATITLHCQPFKYPIEETPIEVAYQYVEGEGENLTLENTADAPMLLGLKGNTQQDSTSISGGDEYDSPSPDHPQQIHTCSGDNTIKVEGKNLYSRDNGQYNVPIYAPDGTSASYQDVNVVWIKVSPNTGYSFTLLPNSTAYYVRIIQCDSNKGFIVRETQVNSHSTNIVTTTKTTRSNCEWLQIGINQYQTSQISQNNWEVMIEESSTPTTYEEYKSASYPISLGVENICASASKFSNTIIQFAIKKTIEKTFTLSFTTNEVLNSNTIYFQIDGTRYDLGTIGSGTSGKITQTYTLTDTIYNAIKNGTTIVLYVYKSGATFDTPEDAIICNGTKIQTISNNPIELNKIGTYQDKIYKDNGKWYLHKEIGKVVFDGSESWADRPNFNDCDRFVLETTTIPQQVYSPLSNYFKCTGGASSTIGVLRVNTGTQIIINFSVKGTTSLADFKTWLSTHNTIVYYTYTTPTNTEITDSTLLETLENIYSMAGTTNITQENNDLPFTINAKALIQGSNTATINNVGNIYSKPTLDIVGNGVVNVSLNGNQIFSVNVSDEIVIDSTNLEAYNPTTHELMNRQVTGNIANLKLDPGENTLTISGDLDTATITNYVRWL